MASLAPYPAHVIPLDDAMEREARQHFSDAFGIGTPRWIPGYLLPGLGLLYQVPGAPRCFVAAARSVAAHAVARNDFWGPAEARSEATALLRELLTWAQPYDHDPPRPRDHSNVMLPTRAARLLRRFRQGSLDASSPLLGPALYAAAWASEHLHAARTWLRPCHLHGQRAQRQVLRSWGTG